MSTKNTMRATLESGGVVKREDFPAITDSTFRSQVQQLRSPKHCGKGRLPLTIVLDKAAGGYRLWRESDAATKQGASA
jgi:hypothetical protein